MSGSKNSNKSFAGLLRRDKPSTPAAEEASTTQPEKVPSEKVKKVQLGTVITPQARLYMDRTWAKAGFKSYAEFVDKAIIEYAKQFPYYNEPLASEREE